MRVHACIHVCMQACRYILQYPRSIEVGLAGFASPNIDKLPTPMLLSIQRVRRSLSIRAVSQNGSSHFCQGLKILEPAHGIQCYDIHRSITSPFKHACVVTYWLISVRCLVF